MKISFLEEFIFMQKVNFSRSGRMTRTLNIYRMDKPLLCPLFPTRIMRGLSVKTS